MRRRLGLLVLAALLTACSGGSSDHALDKIGKTPPAQTLPARWWQWTERFPPDHNPIADPTGAVCAQHQQGKIWFLAGTFGGPATRSCRVPAGWSVYVPVLNRVCSVTSGDSPTAALAGCPLGHAHTMATLDGRVLRVRPATSGGSFDFTTQPGSLTGFTTGTHQAVAWGLWIGPLRLGRGHHVLHFAGSSGRFSLDVTYHLTVG